MRSQLLGLYNPEELNYSLNLISKGTFGDNFRKTQNRECDVKFLIKIVIFSSILKLKFI